MCEEFRGIILGLNIGARTDIITEGTMNGLKIGNNLAAALGMTEVKLEEENMLMMDTAESSLSMSTSEPIERYIRKQRVNDSTSPNIRGDSGKKHSKTADELETLRVSINSRERKRMHDQTHALGDLRKALFAGKEDGSGTTAKGATNLPKVETIILATQYIAKLEEEYNRMRSILAEEGLSTALTKCLEVRKIFDSSRSTTKTVRVNGSEGEEVNTSHSCDSSETSSTPLNSGCTSSSSERGAPPSTTLLPTVGPMTTTSAVKRPPLRRSLHAAHPYPHNVMQLIGGQQMKQQVAPPPTHPISFLPPIVYPHQLFLPHHLHQHYRLMMAQLLAPNTATAAHLSGLQ